MNYADIIERLEGTSGPDNTLDIAVEIALFDAGGDDMAIRANSAGTKVIYTGWDLRETTCWAYDHTLTPAHRSRAIARLRALERKTDA